MCKFAEKLLAEKLIDDYYEESVRDNVQVTQNSGSLTERLKAQLSDEQRELLLRWEAECSENCGRELRQFADYISKILITNSRHEEREAQR